MSNGRRKNKVGRPPLYEKEDVERIIAVRQQGLGIAAFCAQRKISRQTYYDWKKVNPEFAYACEVAIECSQAFLEERMVKVGTGEEKGNIAAISAAYDRQHGSIKVADAAKTEINIGSINLTNMSDKELLQGLQSKMKVIPQDVRLQLLHEVTDGKPEPSSSEGA